MRSSTLRTLIKVKLERNGIVCVFGLSHRSIAVRVGRDPMTVSIIWNGWVQDDKAERCAGFQRPSITSSREDRHVTRIASMDCAAKSRALSHE
ncbi:HTH_Tnp_Tc3_2 domain-containing protein [Trichonephila clavipes]|nr:HTH_Tnp_Tc3_2 domain-containing protein [Trichonephila clavipes]